ncbi:hypothetical protein JYU34_006546 [Plutella xylostella]|uniref:Cytochrome P450 n=1 Tax=Plutella xylostella TaxID=51655 RepID=A0ABQ7QS84_PLUXY|nr:hypothetical protein JYU34_006546 [Plutella xylostella]
MISAVTFLITLPFIILYLVSNAYKRPPNFPPGPPSLPVYGAYWIILAHSFNNLADAFLKLGRRYKTGMVGCYLAAFPAVVVNDPALVKEMLNREELDGRMDILLGRLRSWWKKLGIFFVDGFFWHVQRRFSLRYMRDFGFGRRCPRLEAVLEQQARDMVDMRISGPKYPAEEELVKGDLIHLPHFFAAPFINGMLHVFGGTTLPRSDYHELWTLARGALLFQRSSDDLGRALCLTPWIKDLFPGWSGYNDLRKGNFYLQDYFSKFVNEALETHEEGHDRHFVDMYLTKMKEEMREKGKTTYSVDQLVMTCVDYTFPAASAVEQVLSFMVERLLLQPEVQEKVHEEIDRVVGRARPPSLDDRKNMPYTEACIREVMRCESIVPLGIPHRAMLDTQLGQYDIPEGTLVAANYVALHMDKEIWGDPENFRPERFIQDGQLKPSLDKSLPFGAGRRLCAGETYARQSMFQVFAAFMQAFHVSAADGWTPRPAPRLPGIITSIPDYWVRVTPRV